MANATPQVYSGHTVQAYPGLSGHNDFHTNVLSDGMQTWSKHNRPSVVFSSRFCCVAAQQGTNEKAKSSSSSSLHSPLLFPAGRAETMTIDWAFLSLMLLIHLSHPISLLLCTAQYSMFFTRKTLSIKYNLFECLIRLSEQNAWANNQPISPFRFETTSAPALDVGISD